MTAVIGTKAELRNYVKELREAGKTIALVPTMGALHEGHISLAKLALEHADTVIASIFVNPTQFGPEEDFSRYPRTEEEDVKKLHAAGVAAVYMPSAADMYVQNACTSVHVSGLSDILCGAFRPGHFDGVATVVTKLFMQVTPDVAVFGEKDYQQLHVIRRFTLDLDIPVRIIAAPIMREGDGLAMSSRNRYLSGGERVSAACLYRSLLLAAEGIRKTGAIAEALDKAKQLLLANGFTKIDYMEVRDAVHLERAGEMGAPIRLLAAAWLGKTRLIDNIAVEGI